MVWHGLFGLCASRCDPCDEHAQPVEMITCLTPSRKKAFREEAAPAQSVPQSVLEQLQGTWFRKDDEAYVAVVSGTYLEVKTSWLPRATVFQLKDNLSDKLFLTSRDGQTFVGSICLEAQHSITWSNGEIWLKK